MTDKFNAKQINLMWAFPERAEELAQMHKRLFEAAWEGPVFCELLGRPNITALIAQIGNPLLTVGFIVGRVAADEAEILTIGVAPELQNRGIGRLLVAGLARAAKIAAANRMFLEVASSNAPAVALYRQMGFAQVGCRDNYYAKSKEPREDALVMKLDLADFPAAA